jgi:hypothetical protein
VRLESWQGERITSRLNYYEGLDLVKCTGLRFSRRSPGTTPEQGEEHGHYYQRGID